MNRRANLLVAFAVCLAVFTHHYTLSGRELEARVESAREEYISTVHAYEGILEESVMLSNTLSEPSDWVVSDYSGNQVVSELPERCEAYRSIIERYFPADAVDTALKVAEAESNCNSDRVGDKHLTYWKEGKLLGMSCGLLQVRLFIDRPSCEELKNPEVNIAYSAHLYEKNGWSPWSTCLNGQVDCGLTY